METYIIKSRGGDDTKSNIQTLCVLCHMAKTYGEKDYLGTKKLSQTKNPIEWDFNPFLVDFLVSRHYNNTINNKKGTQKQIEQYIENIKKDYVGFGKPKTKTQQEVP